MTSKSWRDPPAFPHPYPSHTADAGNNLRFGDSGQAIVLNPLACPDSTAGPGPDRLEVRLLGLLNDHANVLYFQPEPSPEPCRAGTNFFTPIVGDRAAIPLHTDCAGAGSRRQRVVVRTDVQAPFRCLVQTGVGFETADKNGHTSLHFAIKNTPAPINVSIATQLLDGEANSRSTNRFGEGCLHLLLKRFSACGVPVQDPNTRFLILSLLVRLLSPSKKEPKMQAQGPQSLMHRDDDGQTPIDAAMMPTVWPLFCEAMERAGHDMARYLVELDRQDGVASPPTEEIKEQCRRYAAPGHPRMGHGHGHQDLLGVASAGRGIRTGADAPHPGLSPGTPDDAYIINNNNNEGLGVVCYVCGQGSSPDALLWGEQALFPFDQLISPLVREQGLGIHVVGTAMTLSSEKKSLRRWVAFQLWEGGKLVHRAGVSAV